MVRVSICPFEPSIKRVKVSHVIVECIVIIHFEIKDFELGIGGEGQDTSGHFEGSFGSIRAILPM